MISVRAWALGLAAGWILGGCGDQLRPHPSDRPLAAPDGGAADWPDAAGSPLDPAWPVARPLPDEFDLPPWVTMPATNRIVIGWRTTDLTRGAVVVRPIGGSSEGERLVESSSGLAQLHRADLGMLEPATAFAYRVVLEDSPAAVDGVFVTPGSPRWRFMHIAEFHAPSSSDQVALFAKTIRAFRPHVIVESGDMLDSGNSADAWRSYLRTAAPWISNAILLPAHSNHVNGTLGNAYLLAYFDLPNNERWYRTAYGQVEFFTLDSTYDSANPDIVGPQIDWLRGELSRRAPPTAGFRIGVWHYPACSSHYASRYLSREWVMSHFIDAFSLAGGADLILVGHDKYYERSLIDGTLPHVQVATGKLAPSTEGDNHERCQPLSTAIDRRSIGLYEVSEGRLDGTIVDSDGTVLDEFTLRSRQ